MAHGCCLHGSCRLLALCLSATPDAQTHRLGEEAQALGSPLGTPMPLQSDHAAGQWCPQKDLRAAWVWKAISGHMDSHFSLKRVYSQVSGIWVLTVLD